MLLRLGIARLNRLVLISLLIWSVTSANGAVRLKRVTAWGGSVNSVEVVGDLAYMGIGARFVILNVADPANMYEVGSIDMENLVRGVTVRDGYAYVCASYDPNHFCIVDVSDPTNPQIMTIGIPIGTVERVALFDDTAYIQRSTGSIWAVDVSDPTVIPYSAAEIESIVEDFVIVDHYLYIAFRQAGAGLRVFDLEPDPLHPTEVGTAIFAPANADARAIAVDGDYAYLVGYVTESMTLVRHNLCVIMDISDPEAPAVLGTYESPNDWSRLYDVAGSNGIAYVIERHHLTILDVASDPSAPTVLSTFETHGCSRGVNVVGSRVYLYDDGEGLIILDVTDPANPVRLGNYHAPGGMNRMAKEGDYLYVSDRDNGISILDVSDPRRPELTGTHQSAADAVFPESYPSSVENWGIAVRDSVAYLSTGHEGLETIDVSDPSAPILMDTYELPDGFHAMALELDGDVARMGVHPYGGGGIMANFDVSDPGDIALLATVGGLGSGPESISTSQDGIAFLAPDSVMSVIDTTDSESPFVISTGPYFATDVALQDNLLYQVTSYTPDDETGLRIFDISNPFELEELSYFPMHTGLGVAVQGQRAYVSGSHEGDRLLVFDVSTPGNPTILAGDPNEGGYTSIFVDGHYVYTTASGGCGSYGGIGGGQGVTIYQFAILGDYDGDYDIDLADFGSFQLCFTGPGIEPADADCLVFDFDDDNDVDLVDFSGFQLNFSGPTALMIQQQPMSATSCPGDDVVLSVNASTASGPLTYQWYKNGEQIDGATTTTYVIDSFVLEDQGSYHVVVADCCAQVQSSAAVVSLSESDIAFVEQPESDSVCAGAFIILSVEVTGTEPISYQWYLDGVPIPNQEFSIYAVFPATPEDAGTYTVGVSNPDSCEPTFSEAAIISLIDCIEP